MATQNNGHNFTSFYAVSAETFWGLSWVIILLLSGASCAKISTQTKRCYFYLRLISISQPTENWTPFYISFKLNSY
jgi:hypothetical protein